MEQLMKTAQIVLKILKENKRARQDDEYLTECVHEFIMPNSTKRPAREVHELIRLNKLPAQRSIERARRKIQAKHPELTEDITVLHRTEQEEKYREFARC